MKTNFSCLSFVVLLMNCIAVTFCFSQPENLDSLMNKGIAFYSKSDYNSAIDIFKECVATARKENNKKVLGNAYNNLGNAYSQMGNSVEGLNYYQLSVRIAEEIHDQQRIAKTTKNIGTLFSEQKDFPAAMKYYEKAHAIALQIKDSAVIADCLNNEGIIYEQQFDYGKALNVYTEALAIYKSEGDESRISMMLNNLGIVYKYLKKYDQSIANYEEALTISEKTNDKFMVAANLNNLGNVYDLKGDYKKSLMLCMQALDKAKEINATEIIVETYDGIATAYEHLKQYPEAIANRKLYEEEKNKFINTERSGQLAEMQTKYETEKKENEIRMLKENERIKNFQIEERNYFLIGGSFLIVAIFVMLYFRNRNQQLKNKIAREQVIKETEENERMRLAKDIHDDLGSGLSKINFLSEIIHAKSSQLPDINSCIESISETSKMLVDNMRDLIWALNPENTTLDTLVSRIREYSTDYFEDVPVELISVYPDDIPKTSISKERHRGLFMVVKESLNNIVKHSKASQVIIEANLKKDQLFISITDNGVGFDPANPQQGNGLRNMKNRIVTVGGLFDLNSELNKGTSINISIPVE